MINFNYYTGKFLEIKLKNQYQEENFEYTIYGVVAVIGGLAPKSEIFNPNPHSCLFVKFKNKQHLIDDNYDDSDTMGLEADDVEEINIL